jgi:septal ring factor EnvC (AmiA/AmiB activator)
MLEQLKQRLEQLKEEYTKGTQRLQQLEQETNDLKSTMLRISGAIQVIQEEIEKVEGGQDSEDE